MKNGVTILIILLLMSLIAVLGIYWFVGFEDIVLSSESKTQGSNFSLGINDSNNMQFYENIRYSDSAISYRIADVCTLQKKADAERAFEILEEETILTFYSVQDNEEILITCQSRQKIKEDFFIAGEGGPVNITKAGDFNVVLYGEVLLIRQSQCPNPNIALHEILHALGFDHSSNSNNIMYDVSKCSQTLGKDIPDLINQLYAIPSQSDLVLDEVSPVIHGKYLDVNISVKNSGLKRSEEFFINIYADDNLLETIDVQPLGIGFGMKFIFKNLQIKRTNFDELRFVIESDFEELDKANNEIIFEVKK